MEDLKKEIQKHTRDIIGARLQRPLPNEAIKVDVAEQWPQLVKVTVEDL